MKRSPTVAAATVLESIGIKKGDAVAIAEIASRLQECNQEAWDDAFGWLTVTDDGAPHFLLADTEDGENARVRHVSEFEKQQITALRWILRRYPWLAAVHQPDPSTPAITIVRDPRDDEKNEPNGIVIRAYVPPADDGDTLG